MGWSRIAASASRDGPLARPPVFPGAPRRGILSRVTDAPARYPFPPYPGGWFAVCLSADLPRRGVRAARYFGRDLVLFRTASGRAVAADAFCPHLGAHLGSGGRVEGEAIVCPFHGFGFDAEGACRLSAYGDPLAGRLRVWPLREIHGVVLVHHDAKGAAPRWEVPPLPTAGWTAPAGHRWRIRTHPQEITENSVDAGHLGVVHRFDGLEMIRPLSTDGPYLTIAYRKTRRLALAGLPVPVAVEFEIHIHGLGHSRVDVRVPELGVRGRLLVLPTPIDGERLDLRLAVAVEEPRAARGAALPLRLLPARLAARLVRSTFLRMGVRDVQQDVAIWENKRYVDPPALARGDGPIGPFRKWCRQFYPEAGGG